MSQFSNVNFSTFLVSHTVFLAVPLITLMVFPDVSLSLRIVLFLMKMFLERKEKVSVLELNLSYYRTLKSHVYL